MINPAIFEHLQSKIDDEVSVRDELKCLLHQLEKQGRTTQSTLSRAHSFKNVDTIIADASVAILRQKDTLGKLAAVASLSPYYKYNALWTRDVQDACFAVLFCAWLGGFAAAGGEAGDSRRSGRLLTIDEVGRVLGVPVNLKEEDDRFHLTVEEYLQALISLIEELARLAVNSVTLGDLERPLRISEFVKEMFAGFQMLNLKNDSLRRRSDGIKYSLKRVEDVVYDLSLRNLLPEALLEDKAP